MAVFILLSLVLSSLNKTYQAISAKELSRRSRTGDKKAHSIHLVAKYGLEASIVFWALIIICSSLAVYIGSQLLDNWAAVLSTAIFLAIVFMLMPRLKIFGFEWSMAAWTAPRVAKTLGFIEPVNRRIKNLAQRLTNQNRAMSEQDLIETLSAQQKSSGEDRLDDNTIELLLSLLKNREAPISKYLVPLEDTKVVSVEESMGPILLDELHQTGQEYFPVREKKKKNIIGTVHLANIMNQAEGGKIKDIFNEQLFYINQNCHLSDVIDAFIKTKNHVYLTIDSKQKITGTISLETAIKALLGDAIETGFDSYEDPASVSGQPEKEEV